MIRKYVAISIKHSIYDKSKTPVLWGKHKTCDDEKRCFSGYTQDLNECELYALGEFEQSYGAVPWIKTDEPVKMCFGYKKKYKNYDTVLVELADLQQFLSYV